VAEAKKVALSSL